MNKDVQNLSLPIAIIKPIDALELYLLVSIKFNIHDRLQ